MSPVAAAAIGGVESFPFLSHRTVAEIASEPRDLFCTPDHVSTVPILHGFGTDNCWQFLFIIPGDGR